MNGERSSSSQSHRAPGSVTDELSDNRAAVAAMERFLGISDGVAGDTGAAPPHESPPTPVVPISNNRDVLPRLNATDVRSPRPEDRKRFPFLDSPERSGDLGKFGPYQIIDVLGEGGMGCVFRAHDPELAREVAIKVMHAHVGNSRGARERFQRESRAAAALQNDHVVPVYHVGTENDIPYIVLPLLLGETLETRLKREPALPVSEVLRIGHETAEGLAAAHGGGLIHRDIKPSNLWLEEPGGRVKILDFGLARHADESDRLTGAGISPGTPPYMSPEHINGKPLDARTDLFSLGAVLYEVATGQRVFTGKTIAEILLQVSTHHPPAPVSLRPELPVALSNYIMQMLEKEPDRRPASARQVADDLDAIQNGAMVQTDTWSGATAPHPPPSRKRLLAVALVGVVILAGLGIWRPWRNQPASSGIPVDTGNNGVSTVEQPLRIQAMEITHLETDNGFSRPRGLIGKESFQTKWGDRVTVRVRLSRPAYAYVLAARPDGKLELRFPESEDEAPPLTDQPSYPYVERGVNFSLTDGAGLCVFATVVSDKPLPPYAEWRAGRPASPWKPTKALVDVVWLDDGQFAEAIKPGGISRGERGKSDADPAQAATTRLTDWLKKGSTNSVHAIGFAVK